MARLALHQPDARSAARLGSALGTAHVVEVCSSWEGLERVLALPDIEGCLLDADHPTPDEAAQAIHDIRVRHPHLALIGFTDRTSGLGYYQLGAAGLEGFVAADDGPQTTRTAVDSALATARGRKVRCWLSDVLPDPGPELLGWAVAHAGPHTTVDRLAEAAGQSPRTLRETLRVRDLGTPATLLLWGRLVLASWRLCRDRRRVEETAYALGYAAASSLGRAFRAQTGLTLRKVSERDGLERVLASLVARFGRRTAPTLRLTA